MKPIEINENLYNLDYFVSLEEGDIPEDDMTDNEKWDRGKPPERVLFLTFSDGCKIILPLSKRDWIRGLIFGDEKK